MRVLVLLPAFVGVLTMGWLVWPAVVQGVGGLVRRSPGYLPRHSVDLIVKARQAEEAAYQAVLDKIWVGAIADMAARASYRREIAWR